MTLTICCQECKGRHVFDDPQAIDDHVIIPRCPCGHVQHNHFLERALATLLEYENSGGRHSVEIRLG